jgi:hypothetical protein
MHSPARYQYAFTSATWSGFAKLDEGSDVTFSVYTAFVQCGAQPMRSKIIGGGDWADGMLYTKVGEASEDDIRFSQCSGDSLPNINTRLGLSENKTGAGSLNGTKLELNLRWRTCTKR